MLNFALFFVNLLAYNLTGFFEKKEKQTQRIELKICLNNDEVFWHLEFQGGFSHEKNVFQDIVSCIGFVASFSRQRVCSVFWQE